MAPDIINFSGSGGPEAERTAQGAGTADSQFVTFEVAGETFAVRLTEVQEIIRLPDLVTVPLSPPSLAGIANLRGAVLPVTSLRRIFGMADVAHDDQSRVVVINEGVPVGFIVDRVSRVVTAEPEDIEDATAIASSVPTEHLSGMIKRAGKVIMIIRPERLINREFSRSPATLRNTLGTTSAAAGGAAEAEASADEVQLVSFVVEGQEYAFPIDSVQEIVTLPGTISKVPNTAPEVIGVITLRQRLLALVSLRRLFNLRSAELAEHNRIVVVQVKGADGAPISVGVVMDTVKAVLRVPRALVDQVPHAVSRGDQRGDVTAICRLAEGKRLVSILSAERMFQGMDLAPASAGTDHSEPGSEPMGSTLKSDGDSDDEEEVFVAFRLAGGEYGVPINSVQEIVRVPEELTTVPKAPDFIKGVVNLRGAVLPVVDQRTRFSLAAVERNDRQRIMVLMLGGKQTGFIVDSVSEVLKVSTSCIGPAPELSNEQARLISRVINMESEKRVILLIEVDRLLSSQETECLVAAA